MNFLMKTGLGVLMTSSPLIAQTVVSYDFNGQWSGWNLRQSAGYGSTENWSKQEEGRTGGAGGNYFGGNVQAPPGNSGDATWLYTGGPALDLSSPGSSLRIQQSWSAFASQDAFVGGTSQAAQIGFLSAPGASDRFSAGDSLYLGVIERSWTAQNGVAPYPGTAVLEIGMFQDGAMVDSFGTFTVNDYGARVGSQAWAQWLEFDILFENQGSGNIGYTVAANTVSYYNVNLGDGIDSVTEGSPIFLFQDSGVLGGNAGLGNLADLRTGLGILTTPGGDVSVTGATYDHSVSGDIIVPVPEPSASTFTLLAGALALRRRKRRSA